MLTVLLWLGVLITGIGVMQWGASRAADVLERVRDRYALPATASGALMGLATASPETAVNLASVSFGWTDLGLGATLGSNVPAVPFVLALAYLGSRFARREAGLPAGAHDGSSTVRPQAVPVQILPYLGVVLLLGLLTLPRAWSGLQPIDGAILFVAWAAFFARAVLKRPWRTQADQAPLDGVWKSVCVALPAIAVGAVTSVYAAQKIGHAFGWSDLVVGLFVIGFLCALPESYSAYRFARERKPTLAVSAATADGIVSLTIALIPSAIVGAAIGNVGVYALNLGFLAAVLSLYALLNKSHGQELKPRFAALFLGLYIGYVIVTIWLLTR